MYLKEGQASLLLASSFLYSLQWKYKGKLTVAMDKESIKCFPTFNSLCLLVLPVSKKKKN